MVVHIKPSAVSGRVLIPASKSHTIRALLIASMAQGKSSIINHLVSDDTLSCIAVCRAFGASVAMEEGVWSVSGTGGRIAEVREPVDVGNSGTTLYLAASLAALGEYPINFTGDRQIQKRPIEPLLQSLRDLGAQAHSKLGNGCAPFSVCGPLHGGKTSIECPTSQYLSRLLIASPLADGNTEIEVPLLREKPYVEMTLRWLDEQFIMYENSDFRRFFLPGGQRYHHFSKQVPGDFSSATFFFCAAAITGGSITVEGCDMNDTQGDKEVLHMLEQMGCSLRFTGGDITLEGRSLRGATLDLNGTPDALPALAAVGSFASGETRLINVPQARLKETDRIRVMFEELTALGADVEELPDGMIVRGKRLKGAHLHGHGDHRVVMALAIAALGAEGETTIDTAEAATVTFPGYNEKHSSCGARVSFD